MPQASYCYVRVVGRGSYGEVTLVRHRRDGRQYVIKKLNLRNASSRERRAAEQEAQLLSQLKHPNIVTYKESWEGGDGLLYIVMGFCEGGDLYRKLKEQKGQLLPESRVVEWFVQIAMALQYLHEKHILHRDLKTQNVFLTRTNIIKVGDLGIARVLEHQSDMASTLIGTPYYMSPELFSNQPYNYKSDVWALGCCVYEMATLKHAFNAKDMNSLVYRIIEGKLPPMPKVYSPELAELIRTMLSRRPEERPSVRSILRQPYIKHQISLFLEATKAKTCKNNVKNGDSRAKPVAAVVSREEASSHEVIHDQPCPSEGSTARDTDQVTSGYRIEKQDSIPRFQPHSCVSEPSVSRQRRQKRREQTDRGQAKSQFQESPPRLLPSHPDDGKVDIISTQQNDENQSRPVAGSVNSSRINSVSSSKDRPLSARERRRLKQSQEEMLPSGPSVRRTSSAVEPVKPREEGQPTPARRFSSDCSVPQEKRQSHGLSEDDELSSSTSSTEKSDGDSREGKSQTNEMSDLVQLMTQTLKLDSRESCEDLRVLNPVSEFRLHRKYRDTLVLHGKAAEEVELHGQALPPAVIPGSEKIRRIVEVLRADVIQGLGVQLLEQVYDLLEAEEDESEREVWMFYLHVCRPDGLRGWKTALDPLELELQMAVCWLGVEHRLSGKAALNYCTIFTALSTVTGAHGGQVCSLQCESSPAEVF
ncbi:serine/threonine-protein kinase Nek4 isoform X6 [Mesocricetus auratus]|uniref:non-specific serine/threonine protein kinase n=1 Tax=Mesocricetus auratus TaxID=10036 RepID=A0ABM2XM19_MESAU|nr:serine/threonine-protein kinase Nek4 isoform X6 [Mesocricetus auratus]